MRTADGRTRLRSGSEAAGGFWRSALKPFQALPIVEDGVVDAFGYDGPRLAVTCASHGGRPEHVVLVREILDTIGLDAGALHCGPHDPYDAEAAAAVRCAGGPTSLHNNCSGKHASMMALALHQGWPARHYWSFEHPVQRRTREILPEFIDRGADRLVWAIDGCGVPTVDGTIAEMALAFAKLAATAGRPDSPEGRVAAAMTQHPQLTSSPGREPAQIMEAAEGRFLVKEGAEGLLCVCAPGEDWGLALKVEDGSRRASGPAVVEVLARAGLASGGLLDRLAGLARPPVHNTLGEQVGRLQVCDPIAGS